jgi:hypothetical protein
MFEFYTITPFFPFIPTKVLIKLSGIEPDSYKKYENGYIEFTEKDGRFDFHNNLYEDCYHKGYVDIESAKNKSKELLKNHYEYHLKLLENFNEN